MKKLVIFFALWDERRDPKYLYKRIWWGGFWTPFCWRTSRSNMASYV